jgi:transcriptional regulator of arginine metabolism
MADRTRRHAAILRLVQEHTVRSQNQLRDLLGELGLEVGQATLSRDIRELGLFKRPGPDGDAAYTVPAGATDPTPALQRLAPALFLAAEGVDHFLVIRTLTGGAQPLAVALDREDWPEILGTIAGDDTILVILREPGALDEVRKRIEELADG